MAKGGLTPREIQCLYLAGRLGLSNDEIGHRLGISSKRVANYLNDAYRKVGVHNRRGAYKAGVFDPGLEIPGEKEMTLGWDVIRPEPEPAVEVDTRPWLARHWRRPPSSRIAILGMILGSGILIAALILGAIGIVGSIFDEVQSIGHQLT